MKVLLTQPDTVINTSAGIDSSCTPFHTDPCSIEIHFFSYYINAAGFSRAFQFTKNVHLYKLMH